MPLRSLNTQQTWLLPPTLDEAEWLKLGIGLEVELLGAPAYHPCVLLGV